MAVTEEELFLYLEHHGIKGMHWGVRREDRQAGRDRRSQKFVEKAKAAQKTIDEINAKPTKSVEDRIRLREAEIQKSRAEKDAQAVSKGGFTLTRKEKFVVGGAVAATAILGTYGVYKMTESGKLRQLAVKGESFFKKTAWHTDPKLADPGASVEQIEKSVVAHINPGYGARGTKNNCRRCTMAYEMRRRGIDVKATKTNSGATQLPTSLFNITHPGEKPLPVDKPRFMTRVIRESVQKPGVSKSQTEANVARLASNWEASILPRPGEHTTQRTIGGQSITRPFVNPESIFGSLSQMPERSRGELGVIWGPGGGHSVAWEIIGGKPVIFDTQTGHVMKTAEEFGENYGHFSVRQAGFTRLDNKPMNKSFLTRWLTNA